MRLHSSHRAARAISPQSKQGLGSAIGFHQVLDCHRQKGGLVFEVSETDVAVAAKYSAYQMCVVIVIHHESCCAFLLAYCTDCTRIVLRLKYCFSVFVCVMQDSSVQTSALTANISVSICCSSVFIKFCPLLFYSASCALLVITIRLLRHHHPIRMLQACPLVVAIDTLGVLFVLRVSEVFRSHQMKGLRQLLGL
jgi:hypothetical protein